ncbi:MAG TPA: stage III sporulation protein AD [Clostridia bacterium]|nr:stage III sporulation protein AD [Clostridia bacterium]
MEILQVVGLGLVAAVFTVILRQQKPEFALLLSTIVGVIIFLMVLGKIGAILDVLRDLSDRANISSAYLGIILKIVGIAYIADFGSQICKDAGENAIATKIEFAAKVLILIIAVPIIIAVLQALLDLL